jgi:hypothetical protein
MVMVLVLLQDGYADIAGLEALHPEFAELPLKITAKIDRADRRILPGKSRLCSLPRGFECLQATHQRAKTQLPGSAGLRRPRDKEREHGSNRVSTSRRRRLRCRSARPRSSATSTAGRASWWPRC